MGAPLKGKGWADANVFGSGFVNDNAQMYFDIFDLRGK